MDAAEVAAPANGWKTWLVPSPSAFAPLPPPERGSLRELEELQRVLKTQLDPVAQAEIARWEAQGGLLAWTRILLDRIRMRQTDPVKAARGLALMHAAMADAVACCWHAKGSYARQAPWLVDTRVRNLAADPEQGPSYPSEHGAIAAAAATVLSYLYPGDIIELDCREVGFVAAAHQAARSRVAAGACYPSDIDAGFRLGQAIGYLAIDRAQADGSGGMWDSSDPTSNKPGRDPSKVFQPRPVGLRYWVPTPPRYQYPPLHPLAGQWTPWLVEDADQFQPPPPPAWGNPFPTATFIREAAEVRDTVMRADPRELRIALFWADNPGITATPPGHWIEVASEHVTRAKLSTQRAARAMALLSVGLADSAICCWRTKYTYWVVRPITAVRTLKGYPFFDPNFITPVITPPFPSYTSGHATFSACSAEVLEHLFPGGTLEDAFGNQISFREAARQAADSRLFGGIHYRSDNEAGLDCGRKVARVVIEHSRQDGWT